MPTTRLQACSAQPAEQVTSPRANTPRRVLRSRQGQAGVIINLGEGGTSFIVARGPTSATGYSVSKCKDKRCLTCKNLILSKKVISNVTGRTYDAVKFSDENLTCHSQNIIYLCTCLSGNIQYVGETAIVLHKRINGHRTAKQGCEHEIRHCKESCNGYNFKFQILEKLPGTGYNTSGELDPEMAKIRKAHEDMWIKRLRTIYPYGLNEKASDKETNSSVIEPAIGKLFPPLSRNGSRPSRSRENRNDKTSILSCQDFFDQLDTFFDHNLHNSFNEIRKILNLVKKKVLKEIAFHILERDTFNFYENRFQWYHYILDIIDTKFLNPSEIKRKPVPKNVIVINFVNKGLDDIHISKIFRSADVISLLPEALQNEEDIPRVTMKLDPPIRSKILNYKETVSSLDIVVDEDISFVRNLPSCECKDSEFCDPFHKHIVSGDLPVVTNQKLRKLLSKGPNYREPKTLNYHKCKKSIESSLSSSIDQLAFKYNISVENFSAWKTKILQLTNQRINVLKSKKVPSATKPILEDEEALSSLSELHRKFVIVPIDKATNNVAIICKRFYVQKLLNEVGIPGNTSSTYKMSERNPDDVIGDNSLLSDKFGINLEDRLQTLPFMYWLPKMHYTPSRSRFIVASNACSTKPLSTLASKIYKHIFNQVRNFHMKSTFYRNYNRFWVIENSSSVIDKLSKLNDRG